MDFITLYFYFFISLIGLVFGSFLNCWAARIVNGTSIVNGRSVCDSCGHELGALDLIPVLSWLFSKGKCRYCKAKIPFTYPLTEIVCGLGFLGIAYKFGLSLECLKWLFLFCILFVTSLVDIYDGWIPDRFIIAGIVGFFLFNIKDLNGLKSGLIGGFSIFIALYSLVLIFNKIKKTDSMGGGDLKLFFVLGLYFGLTQTALLMFISCLVGIIFAYATNKRESTFPFGPSIAIAAYITLMIGEIFINWYFSLF